MKTLLNLLVVLVATLFVGCGKTEEKKSAPVPNDAATASAHILGALPAGESASVRAETIVGEAAVIHQMAEDRTTGTVTRKDGTTITISRTENPVAKQDAPAPQTVKVEVVASGNIGVTGNGNIDVTGTGNIPVKAEGSIGVKGSGVVDVKGSGVVSTGKVEIGGKAFELYKDQCGGIYYRGTDGKLYPIK